MSRLVLVAAIAFLLPVLALAQTDGTAASGSQADSVSSPSVPDATTAATEPVPAEAKVPNAALAPGFLGFDSQVSFHVFSGWMSGGLLLAAGVAGGIHFLGMMETAHAQRDGLNLDDYNPSTCDPILLAAWNNGLEQGLRWTHVALLSTGELFYLANAFTGTGFMGPLEPGWNRSRIHRYAFFAHAALMVAEAAVGLALTDALSRADHEAIGALGAAHAAIGIAVPVIILGAGAVMSF